VQYRSSLLGAIGVEPGAARQTVLVQRVLRHRRQPSPLRRRLLADAAFDLRTKSRIVFQGIWATPVVFALLGNSMLDRGAGARPHAVVSVGAARRVDR